MRFLICALCLAGFLAGASGADGPNVRPGVTDASSADYGTYAGMVKDLGLTAEQGEKIKALISATNAAVTAAYKSLSGQNNTSAPTASGANQDRSEVAKKVDALQAELRTQITDLLTEEQKTLFLAAVEKAKNYKKNSLSQGGTDPNTPPRPNAANGR